MDGKQDLFENSLRITDYKKYPEAHLAKQLSS